MLKNDIDWLALHNRFGHCSQNDLQRTFHLSSPPSFICDTCAENNTKRGNFKLQPNTHRLFISRDILYADYKVFKDNLILILSLHG